MRDPERPQLDRVVQAAMRDLDRKERGVPKDLPRGRRMYMPSGVRSYMSETSDDYKAFITPPDVGLPRTSEDDTRALASSLPCDWLIRECSRLIRRLERPGSKEQPEQLSLAAEWAPDDARGHVERLIKEEGGIFLHQEQLLAIMRLAIEYGTERATTPLRTRIRDFSALLLSVNDRLSDEGPPETADEDAYTAFGMRSMGYAASQVLWHLLGRTEATWFTVRELLKSSTKYVPVDEEFERITRVRLSAFLAAITATFAYTEHAFDNPDKVSWAIEPTAFFAKTPDPTGMRPALDLLVGSREWYRTAFAKRAAPRFVGIAMLPFRQRPLYQLSDGHLIAVSAHYLVERGMGGVYWTIADNRTDDDKRRRQFTDFVGEIHERYISELVKSTVNREKNVEAVYTDTEATPAKRGADTVILGPRYGVFLETTSTALNYERTIAAADLISFDAEANEKVVKKIVQVEDAVADYRDAAVTYPSGSDATRYERTIWPVVVLREPFPYFFLIARRLGRLLAATKLKREHRADPPVRIMSAEEIELALEAGRPERLHRLLKEWQMDDAYKDESFRNFYLHRYPRERVPDAPYLKAAYEGAFARAARELGFPPPRRLGTRDTETH
jgi:hypothetical protein